MSDEELLAAVRKSTPPGATAASLSKEADLSRQRIAERLKRLEGGGRCEMEELSAVVLYWVED